MINRDLLENQAKSVYLGIGSNLGNRCRNIENAKFKLYFNNIVIKKTSSFYETLSWPNPKNPKFINIIIEIKTHHTPKRLMKICQKIEIELGRKKTLRNAPRICDIDIIDYCGQIINNKIETPHKSLHKRNFVLIPLFEINKKWIHPLLNLNIKKLILSLSNKDIRSIKQI